MGVTRRGFGFLLLTILVYLAANQTRVGWLYLIAAAMVWVLVLSAVLPFVSLRGLGAALRVLDRQGGPLGPRTLRPRDGDDIQIVVHLTAPGDRPLLRVTTASPCAEPEDAPLVFFIPRLRAPGVILNATVRGERRGVFPLPPVLVETRAPFGLFRRRCTFLAPGALTVYPRWYALGGAATAAALLAVQAARPRVGAGDAFFGTREYRPGDPVRAIHWRSSLRRGQLVVKEFEDTARPELAIALDLSREVRDGPASTLEDSIRLAASLVRWALDAAFPVYLLAPGAPRAALAWPQALDYLARVLLVDNASLSEAVARSPEAAALIVLSPEPDVRTRDLLAARRGAPTAVVSFAGYGPEQNKRAAPWPAGVPLVNCRPGEDLAAVGTQALQALLSGHGATDSPQSAQRAQRI